MRAILIALVLFGGVFAGCLGLDDPRQTDGAQPRKKLGPVAPEQYVDKLSKVVYDTILKENVKVASFDGKRMDNWVFRPDVQDGTKVPVFVNFSPYWTNLAPAGEFEGDAFSKYMIHEYVPRGYAVVLSSVRGTGYSEGCFNIGGEVEQRDAVAVIEHFSKVPWSDGNVAAGGKSYDGTTPQGAAIRSPDALKAIVPVSGISELYKYNYKGGIPYGNGASFNAYYYAGVGGDVPPYGQPKAGQPLLVLDDVACPELPEMQASGVGSAATGDYTPYWQQRNYSKAAKNVQAALFFVHGFTDWNVKPDHILPWLDNIPADVPRKVWLHNWTLGHRVGGDGHVYPMRDDFNVTMLRFLDQTLKGMDTGIFDEPAYQVADSDGTFRWEETWPPADVVRTRYYFSNRALAQEPGPGAQAVFADTPPNVPAPGSTGTTTGGVCRQPASETALRYELTLPERLHYAGEPIVHLQLKSDRPLGKVIVTLCALPPIGATTTPMINWGGLNLRHRIALENPQPVMPETMYQVQFPLFPQDDVVPAGWKLVAYVGGSGGQYQAAPYGNRITITEGPGSWIEFPVQTEFQYEEPQPTKIPCFTC